MKLYNIIKININVKLKTNKQIINSILGQNKINILEFNNRINKINNYNDNCNIIIKLYKNKSYKIIVKESLNKIIKKYIIKNNIKKINIRDINKIFNIKNKKKINILIGSMKSMMIKLV